MNLKDLINQSISINMKNNHLHTERNALNRKMIDPADFVFTGNADTSENTKFNYISYSKDEFIINKAEEQLFTPNENMTTWISITGLKDVNKISNFCQENEIHNLSIQDILDINQRPKFQQFDNYLFLTLKQPRLVNNKLEKEQFSFIVKDNCLISFQESSSKDFDHIIQRITKDIGVIREKDKFYLLYTLIESILDDYLRVLKEIETTINLIDFDLNKEPSTEDFEKLENYKKHIFFVKQTIQPVKDFALKMERKEIAYNKNLTKYFSEIKDLCLTIIDDSELIDRLIDSDINIFFSIQGRRMNQIMKTLTVVAAIFIPLTFLAGVYGMNFSIMPELEMKYGYLGAWLVFFIIAIMMIIYFRKKEYFK